MTGTTHIQVDVGGDAVLECKVNNLGTNKVVDPHNDHGDDDWLVMLVMMMLLTTI